MAAVCLFFGAFAFIGYLILGEPAGFWIGAAAPIAMAVLFGFFEKTKEFSSLQKFAVWVREQGHETREISSEEIERISRAAYGFDTSEDSNLTVHFKGTGSHDELGEWVLGELSYRFKEMLKDRMGHPPRPIWVCVRWSSLAIPEAVTLRPVDRLPPRGGLKLTDPDFLEHIQLRDRNREEARRLVSEEVIAEVLSEPLVGATYSNHGVSVDFSMPANHETLVAILQKASKLLSLVPEDMRGSSDIPADRGE